LCLAIGGTLLWMALPVQLRFASVHGTLVGMTSNHDLLPHAHELKSLNSLEPFATHKLAHEMSSRFLSATSTTEICEIVHVMLDEQEGAIPIFDNSRQLVSILTTSDILKAIVHRSPLELWT
jgi:acetoin utilization protein AcuB